MDFYRIPASMSIDDKLSLLLKAFDQGAIVIIDEINSAPMMERKLNHLLMGRTPEGKRPSKPGFMVIGTQNPAEMGGRKKTSTALARRIITLKISDYNQDEIIELLTAKGMDGENASLLAKAYHRQVNHAAANQLEPAPTFRRVLQIADKVLGLDFIDEQSIEQSDEENSEMISDSDSDELRDFYYIDDIDRLLDSDSDITEMNDTKDYTTTETFGPTNKVIFWAKNPSATQLIARNSILDRP